MDSAIADAGTTDTILKLIDRFRGIPELRVELVTGQTQFDPLMTETRRESEPASQEMQFSVGSLGYQTTS